MSPAVFTADVATDPPSGAPDYHIMSKPIIAVTLGDVAGIGPEVVLHAVQDAEVLHSCQPIVIGHPKMLSRAAGLRPTAGDRTHVIPSEMSIGRKSLETAVAELSPGTVPVINPCDDDVLDVRPCEVSAVAGAAAFQCLTTAAKLALFGSVSGIATAPLNKESLNSAGYDYPGHTEILAAQCSVREFAMMLHLRESRLQPLCRLLCTAGPERDDGHGLSIAHVTLHTSIASVPQLLSRDSIVTTVTLMRDFLKRLGSRRQSIAVAALNPHAGEHGLFGDEESTLIAPAVESAVRLGCNVAGPFPVDAVVRRAISGEFDGVVAMYHDQGHIPMKLFGFDSAVNITLGLPITRTSPTHGTAFDRAWNPVTPADPSGMIEAILTASQLSPASV